MSADSSKPIADDRYDLALVGGGLQNGLIALACFAQRPELRVVLVEQGSTLGGNHTWAIHPGDVPEAARSLVDPLIAQRWAGYDVRFPTRARTLHAPYAAITSTRFDSVLQASFASRADSRLLLGKRAQTVAADHVLLESGERLDARMVIDARGPEAQRTASGRGFQKFVGLELELRAEHGLSRPILMDATVPQTDGFRFFYVLPFSPTRLLVEDTVFSRSPVLDLTRARSACLEYAARFGAVASVVREEQGCLPMPWTSSFAEPTESPLVAGYQGGFFHPATGYSFPIALRLSCHVARTAPDAVLGSGFAALWRELRSQARFAEQLNHMLFHWFAPEAMWNVFDRFYGLPEELIHRFYALSMTRLDRARIVVGRPPRGLSLNHAFSALSGAT